MSSIEPPAPVARSGAPSSPVLPEILASSGLLGQELSRRSILKGTATGVAAMGLAAMWPSTARATVGGPGGLVTRSDLLMLVNRVSQGFTLAEFNKATGLGYANYLADVLNGPANSPLADAIVAAFYKASWTPSEVYQAGGNPDDVILFTQGVTMHLSVVSERILLERMMDLWSNRLNVYGKKPGVGALKNYSDYHIIRPNALGSAKTLLTSFAKDTAVLYYLDNVFSAGPIANENFAREFLELYTMGQDDPVSGAKNYSEADVQAAARAFTGWSADSFIPVPPLTNPNVGLFQYKPGMHISGPKTFQTIDLIPDDATTSEGDQVVSIVVNSLKTGRGIAYKMIRHLLRQDPQSAQVNSASLLYRNADIKAMIADILSQANVAALTPSDYLLSSPSRFVYQALRASGANTALTGAGVYNELQRMGNAPFEWPAPDGYPDEPEKWAGSLFARWEFANKLFAEPVTVGAQLVNPQLPGTFLSDAEIMAMVEPLTTIQAAIEKLNLRFTGGVLSENEKSVLDAYAYTVLLPPFNFSFPATVRDLAALIISGPTFQYY